jgi:hypothetical protein
MLPAAGAALGHEKNMATGRSNKVCLIRKESVCLCRIMNKGDVGVKASYKRGKKGARVNNLGGCRGK